MKKILETKNLILREYTTDDLEEWYMIVSDPETMNFWPEPFTKQQAKDWIESSLEDYQKLRRGRYALTLKANNKLIGDCGFKRYEIQGRMENDLGYIIDKAFWGQGYATEAAKACLDYGLEVLKLERIIANMESTHIASKRVAEKLGMKLEKEFHNPKNLNKHTLLYSIMS